ncbi:Regulatory protein RecX [Arabidopsis suecica]|uniref:Regulatory protein RecX n=1 Tax=Arabidopsis suecica TaxID=45249 RepID=A0A8T2BCS5_ARASU|nr:Regulatory protein RecX [Arabidopsis suecica]
MLKQGFRLSIAIQHRVFVIPWVKRHSAPRILCSDQRDYSSSGLISGLIKYVPNKSRKITQDLTSQPLDVTRLDHSVLGSQVKGNSKEARDGTFLDLQEKNDTGSYMNVSCDDSDEELEESSNQVRSTGCKSTRQHKQAYDKVKLHMETEQAKSSKEACKTTQEAEHMAIRYLGLRAYSAADLKKKLMGKKYPLEVVDRVINDFQIRGFINDSLYAESFTRSRWSSLSWGPRRIKQALFKKGISNKDSETAIKLVFEKRQCNEGDEEPELNHGLSKEAVDQLYVQASKRWLQGRDLPIETRKARVIRWLQYRGFNWGVVAQLLKRLESTHES